MSTVQQTQQPPTSVAAPQPPQPQQIQQTAPLPGGQQQHQSSGPQVNKKPSGQHMQHGQHQMGGGGPVNHHPGPGPQQGPPHGPRFQNHNSGYRQPNPGHGGGHYREQQQQQQYTFAVPINPGGQYRAQYSSPSSSPAPSHHGQGLQGVNDMNKAGTLPQQNLAGQPYPMYGVPRQPRPHAPYYNGTNQPRMPQNQQMMQPSLVYNPMLGGFQNNPILMNSINAPGGGITLIPTVSFPHQNGQPPGTPPSSGGQQIMDQQQQAWLLQMASLQYGHPQQAPPGPNHRQMRPFTPMMANPTAVFYPANNPLMQHVPVAPQPARQAPHGGPADHMMGVPGMQGAPSAPGPGGPGGQPGAVPQGATVIVGAGQQPGPQPPQPQPRRERKGLQIIDPKSGEDVMANYKSEQNQVTAQKTRQPIDIRSPSGEPSPLTTAVAAASPTGAPAPVSASVPGGGGAEASPRSPVPGATASETGEVAEETAREPAAEAAVTEAEGTKEDDISRDSSRISNSALVDSDNQSSVKPEPTSGADSTSSDVSKSEGKGVAGTSAKEPQAAHVNGEAAAGGPAVPDVGKAIQRPKDKRKGKSQWETKGVGGSGDMDAFKDSETPATAASSAAAAVASPSPPPTVAAAPAATRGSASPSPSPSADLQGPSASGPASVLGKDAQKAVDDSKSGSVSPTPSAASRGKVGSSRSATASPTISSAGGPAAAPQSSVPTRASESPSTSSPSPAAGGSGDEKSDAPAAPSHLANLKYDEGQWRPDYPEGKKVYDDVFLRALERCPYAVRFPAHLINPSLSIVKMSVDAKSKVSQSGGPGGGGGGGGPGQFDGFMPAFMIKAGGGGGGGGGGMPAMGYGNRMAPPKRGSQGRRPPQQQQQQQQQRVITVSMEEVKLQRAENAWKPGKIEPTDSKEQQELCKKVRGILNKLTPQKFDTLVGKVKELEITNASMLMKVIDMVFEKACDEPGFAVAYARMCHELATKMRVISEDGKELYFRKALLMKCQQEFEAERLFDEDRDTKLAEIAATESEEKKKEMTAELDDKDRKMKRRYLGTIRFIGELFMMSMLTVKIMHECVQRLLSGWNKRQDEDSLECLCKLLATIGKKMDDPQQQSATKTSSQYPEHQVMMRNYFDQMQGIVDEKGTSSRVRFMLLDVIDLRKGKWVPRREDNNPKTIDQIHKEAEAEETKRNIEINELKRVDRQSQQGRGGRGGPTGSRGGNQQQQQPQDDWQQVQSLKRQPTSYDTNKLQAMAQQTLGTFGPGGGGYAWGKSGSGRAEGSSGGGGGTPSSNKFGLLSDMDGGRGMPNRNLPPRMQKGVGFSKESAEREKADHLASAKMHMRGPGQDLRPTRSQGSSRDGGGHGQFTPKFGAAASMMASTGPMSSRGADSGPGGPGSFGPHKGAPPGLPFSSSSVPPLGGERDRPQLSAGPPSGAGGPPSLVSPPGGKSSFMGKPDASHSDLKNAIEKITDETCSRDCDPSSESVEDVIEKFHETTLHVLVQEGINHSLEKQGTFRRGFGAFMRCLVQKGLLVEDAFVRGLGDLVSSADDLIIDIPKFWDFLGEILGPVFTANDGFKLDVLPKCNVDPLYVEKMCGGVLRAIAASSNPNEALNVWKKGGVKPENIDEFVKQEKLDFFVKEVVVGGKEEWVSEKTSEKFREEFLKRLKETNQNDELIHWIDRRVAKECQTENYFMRAFVSAILESAITRGDTEGQVKLDKDRLLARVTLLMRFMDNKPEAEMQALFAATQIFADYKHPRGLMTEIFEVFDDSDLIAEDSFNQWYEEGSRQNIRGYAIAHEAVKQFFVWLRQSDEEDAKSPSEPLAPATGEGEGGAAAPATAAAPPPPADN